MHIFRLSTHKSGLVKKLISYICKINIANTNYFTGLVGLGTFYPMDASEQLGVNILPKESWYADRNNQEF